MKTPILTIAATLAGFIANAAESVELKTLAKHWQDDNAADRFVLGTGDYDASEWGWTKERVFDGVVELDNAGTAEYRWFEPGWVNSDNENAWAGYELAEAAVVSRIRFMPRHDEYASRVVGCRFEGANSADFSDSAVLYTIPETELATLQAGWQEVELPPSAATYKYLRVAGAFCGNMIEVEFYGTSLSDLTDKAPSATPQNLAVSTDAATGETTLSWDAPAVPCLSAKVIRSTAEGGSNFDVVLATLDSSATTYTDTSDSRVSGVTYYYRVAFANSENTGPASSAVAARYIAEIDVSGAAMLEFHHDYNTESATASAALLFDGNTATQPNVVNASAGNDGVAVGVDFGKGNSFVVSSFSVFPSREWNNTLGQWVVGRSDGIVLYGAADVATWPNAGVAISSASDLYEENVWDEDRLAWHTFATTDSNAYRCFYLMKPSRETLNAQRTDDFFGNVRELKLYGYSPSAVADVLAGPADVAAVWNRSRANITWSAVAAASGYRVERSADGGAWEPASATITETSFSDEPTRPTAVSYKYRVVAIGENGAEAYSAAIAPAGTPSEPGLTLIFR